MHCSAKRGIAIACRLSVRSSVTVDHDHIGWKAWKLTARKISSTPSLGPKATHPLPGEHGEIWGRLEVGWKKVACCSTKAAISLKHVKIEEKLLWRAYRNSPTLVRTGTNPDHAPSASSSPRLGVRNLHPKL